MEIQPGPLKEVLSELFALLEAQETNSTAVLQLLRDQGIASDEKLASYLDQAGRASNVKWRAARMRMEYLLTPIQKEKADEDKTKEHKAEAAKDEVAVEPEDKDSPQDQAEAKSQGAPGSENPPDENPSSGDGTSRNEKKENANKQSA